MYSLYVYIQTWTRMSPYVCGMYAAYLHLKDKDHTFMTNSAPQIIFEWISFLNVVLTLVVNHSTAPELFLMNWGAAGFWIHKIYFTFLERTIFGVCLSYLLVLMLSPEVS
jgi:hypothetical protein